MLNIEYTVLMTVSRNMGTFKYGWRTVIGWIATCLPLPKKIVHF